MKKAISILAIGILLLIVACEQQAVTVTQQPQATQVVVEEPATPAVVQPPVVVDEYTDLLTAQDSFDALDEALELYE